MIKQSSWSIEQACLHNDTTCVRCIRNQPVKTSKALAYIMYDNSVNALPMTGGWVRCWAGAALAGHLRQGVQACAVRAGGRGAAPKRGAQARPGGLAQPIGHRRSARGAERRRKPPRPARQLLQQPLRAPARCHMQSNLGTVHVGEVHGFRLMQNML